MASEKVTVDKENVLQAISDFDDIESAVEELGVDIPKGTDTSEYGDIIRSNLAKAGTGLGGDYYTKTETDALLEEKLNVDAEVDPSVPDYVKNISQSDIEKWSEEPQFITNSEIERMIENG